MERHLFDLSGRRAVVTGAASGLGRAIAVGLAQYGAKVALADLNEEGLAETRSQVESAGGQSLALPCDVTRPETISRVFAEVDAGFGGVDILVNSAGVLP